MADNTFDKLKTSVNRGITTISVKTSSTLEKAKLKTHIDSLEKEKKKLLLALGEDAYRLWINGNDSAAPLRERCEAIGQMDAEIKELNAEVGAIESRDQQILGTKVEDPSGPVICPNCKAQYETRVNFCRQCGNRIE